jgi:hypothetical protein
VEVGKKRAYVYTVIVRRSKGDYAMGYDARIDSLRLKHAEIDAVLETEVRRPTPDPAMLADLKRQKLRIKDEISRFSPSTA